MTVSGRMIVQLRYANDVIVNILSCRIATNSTYKQLYEKLKFGYFIFSCFGTSYNQYNGRKNCVGKVI
jgi:hypothetical protein